MSLTFVSLRLSVLMLLLENCELGECAHFNANLWARQPYQLQPYHQAYKQSEYVLEAIDAAVASLRRELETLRLMDEQRALFA